MFVKRDQSQRQDSAFYHTEDGAENVWDGNERFFVDRVGEMSIVYTDEDGVERFIHNTADLDALGIDTDEALAEFIGTADLRLNSWFEIWDDSKQEYVDGEVYHELDEAVERAIHLYDRYIQDGEE